MGFSSPAPSEQETTIVMRRYLLPSRAVPFADSATKSGTYSLLPMKMTGRFVSVGNIYGDERYLRSAVDRAQ